MIKKVVKKCKICRKIIRIQNKSGLCNHCYKITYAKRRRKERKEKHLCITCGTKIKDSYVRCQRCRENQRESNKKYYQRPEVKKKLKEYYQRPEVKKRIKKYQKEYYQRPKVKKRKKEYQQREDIKLRRKKQRQIRKLTSVTPLK